MSAKPLRYASQKRFAKNVVKSDVRAPAAAARRLAALGVDDMPWLSPEGLRTPCRRSGSVWACPPTRSRVAGAKEEASTVRRGNCHLAGRVE